MLFSEQVTIKGEEREAGRKAEREKKGKEKKGKPAGQIYLWTNFPFTIGEIILSFTESTSDNHLP